MHTMLNHQPVDDVDTSCREGSSLSPGAETFDPPSRSWLEEAIRRGLDIVVSATALVVLAPLMAVIAVLVRIDSPGPAVFRQYRVGRNRRSSRNRSLSTDRRQSNRFGSPFTLWKFRTMYADSRERFPELYSYAYSPEELRTIPIKLLPRRTGSTVNFAGESRSELGVALLTTDPRVTRMGRWLRRTSFDELPNLVNVLRGDMHLVGPRPDIVDNVQYYSDHQRKLLDVKPGVTGLAQVKGRGFLTFEQTNALDLEYVQSRSLLLDIKILLATIPAIFKREGAY